MKSELLDGEEAYVIQATPLPGQEQDLTLPGGKKLASITIYIAKTMSQIRLVAADDAGAQIASVALKDILTNLPFESSRFTYAPPSGVAVMKMEDLIKQMPGGMPGMPAMPK